YRHLRGVGLMRQLGTLALAIRGEPATREHVRHILATTVGATRAALRRKLQAGAARASAQPRRDASEHWRPRLGRRAPAARRDAVGAATASAAGVNKAGSSPRAESQTLPSAAARRKVRQLSTELRAAA